MDARARLLEIHASVREDASVTIDEANFMASLTRPLGKPLEDSFKGLRYKNSFLEKVEMSFGICLTEADLSRTWGLDEFARYVDSRSAKSDTNLALARKRIGQQKGGNASLFVMVAVVFLVLTLLSPSAWKWLPILAYAVVMAILWRYQSAAVRHYRDLAKMIEEKAA